MRAPLKYIILGGGILQFSNYVKQQLEDSINYTISRKEDFVTNPQKDFVRNRKFNLYHLIKFILSMQGNSINKELLDYAFDCEKEVVTASAFVQQRTKLKASAFKNILDDFTSKFQYSKKLKGYRILAADGCMIQTPYNPNNTETYMFNGPRKQGWNRIHLNALYDVLNRIYIDANIEVGTKYSEASALINSITKHNFSKSIVIADRGFEVYHLFEVCQELDQKYIIRVKEPLNGGILYGTGLDNIDFIDENIQLNVSRTMGNHLMKLPGYSKCISYGVKLDHIKSFDDTYTFHFRLIKIQLFDGNYEYLLTNLNKDEFTTKELKELYHMRWGIESSFRELKYALGLLSFHSSKLENTMQEVYAKLIMHNFCELIITHTQIEKNTSQKHDYQANYTMAIRICLKFYRCNSILMNVEKLIKAYILPIRSGRSYPRNKKRRDPKFFNYRIA